VNSKSSKKPLKQKKAKRNPRIHRLPPTAAAARDEGPRLLPLGDRVSEPSRLEHYLDLADAALGRRDQPEVNKRQAIPAAEKTR
jgi:hypothetical protein